LTRLRCFKEEKKERVEVVKDLRNAALEEAPQIEMMVMNVRME